jgi:uncharacterized protein (TIGR03067 family)
MSKCSSATAFLAMVLAGCAAPPSAPVSADPEAILGKWRVESAWYGQEMRGGESVWTITKTHFVMTSGGEDAYTLDAGKKPMQFDLTVDRDGRKESVVGIFEVRGDELRISVTETPNPRPVALEIGRNHNYFILRRVKEAE